MDGTTLQKTAADCAEQLPGSRLEHPFGPDWDVFKVRNKVFMLMTEIPGRPIVILKSDPAEAQALLRRGVGEMHRHRPGDGLGEAIVPDIGSPQLNADNARE
jgi:YjbR